MDFNAYLDKLVPPSAHNDGVLRVRTEPHARNPLSMALVGNCKLAIAQCIPQLDRAIAGAGDDLTVIGGEGDGEDIVRVTDETAGRGASSEFPQPERLVPRGRESVCTV